jgi:hypothetical protein
LKPAKKKRPVAPENPDIDFTANVKARELYFEEVPETEVRFRGDPERDSVSSTERENLPEEVQRGVTYRNASVRFRIASKLIGDESDLWKGRKEE